MGLPVQTHVGFGHEGREDWRHRLPTLHKKEQGPGEQSHVGDGLVYGFQDEAWRPLRPEIGCTPLREVRMDAAADRLSGAVEIKHRGGICT